MSIFKVETIVENDLLAEYARAGPFEHTFVEYARA
jgi:hypothetical protein